MWSILAFIALVVLLGAACGMLGCESDTHKIAKGANHVQSLANETKQELQAARNTGELTPAVAPHIDAADGKQDEIVKTAQAVGEASAGVTDKVWAGWAVLRLWGIVAAVLAIVGAAVYFGFGPIIRRITAWLGWFIPKADQEAAAMDLAAMRAHPESAPVREAIAAKRARKATYEAALRKAKRKEREQLLTGRAS